jgi:hypothetical protein
MTDIGLFILFYQIAIFLMKGKLSGDRLNNFMSVRIFMSLIAIGFILGGKA